MTCDTLAYKMEHSGFILCSFMENSMALKRVNYLEERRIQAARKIWADHALSNV